MAKNFYWLKLNKDFFNTKEVKKLRKLAGGDTYSIIYLKMLLLSIPSDGILVFEGIENTFEEEIALSIDEEFENVRVVLIYLKQVKLIEQIDDDSYLLSACLQMIGKECDSASRVRRHRESKKLQESNITALPSNINVTDSNSNETMCNTEKSKRREEKSIELELENKKTSAPTRKESVSPKRSSKSPKSDKVHFADFVTMTNDEYTSLIEEFGEPMTLELISILDNYKGSSGRKYKSDFRTIKSWVIDKYYEVLNKRKGFNLNNLNSKPKPQTSSNTNNLGVNL